jgi:uncharacterized protein YqgC (DUF456 family)
MVKWHLAIVLEQCHVVGFHLPLVPYTALVVVAFIGWCIFSLRSEAASPDLGAL